MISDKEQIALLQNEIFRFAAIRLKDKADYDEAVKNRWDACVSRDAWKAKAEALAKVIEELNYYDEASVLKAKAALAEYRKEKL